MTGIPVFAVLLCCVCLSLAHNHVYPSAENLITGVQLDGGRVRRQASREPIRIVAVYHESVDTALDPAKAQMIRTETMPKVMQFFEDSLSVDRIQTPIRFQRLCEGGLAGSVMTDQGLRCSSACLSTSMCQQIPIPEEHLQDCIICNNSDTSNCENLNNGGAGISNADVVLYVSAIDTNCPPPNPDGSQIIAFAGACQTEAVLNRPIAGNVNFCPLGVTNSLPGLVLDITKHETAHVLGLAALLLALWRDENGNPRTPRDALTFDEFGRVVPSPETVRFNQVYDDWATINGPIIHTVTHMVTPAVLREAQAHFDCPSLAGVELENQGGPQSSLSHWEKRIFGNEAMTSTLLFNPVFSRISLAAFEDSGWYDVNYDMAGDLAWGRGAGCGFATGSCLEWINTRREQGLPTAPFCTEMAQQGCTIDREAVGICNLVTLPDTVPADFQYFTNPSQGGGLAAPDFCPFVLPLQVTEPSGRVRGTDCRALGNLPDNNQFAESYGTGSRCLEHGSRAWSNTRDGQSNDTVSAGCYQYSCSPTTGVTVVIGNLSYQCLCEGQEIRFTFNEGEVTFNGSFICPACSQICYDDLGQCPSTEPPTCYGMVTEVQGVPPGGSGGVVATSAVVVTIIAGLLMTLI